MVTFIECAQLSTSPVWEKCFPQRGSVYCIVHRSAEICLQQRDGGGKMAQRIQAPLNAGLCLIISREGLSVAPLWKGVSEDLIDTTKSRAEEKIIRKEEKAKYKCRRMTLKSWKIHVLVAVLFLFFMFFKLQMHGVFCFIKKCPTAIKHSWVMKYGLPQ